jgi:hypothetical protein
MLLAVCPLPDDYILYRLANTSSIAVEQMSEISPTVIVLLGQQTSQVVGVGMGVVVLFCAETGARH